MRKRNQKIMLLCLALAAFLLTGCGGEAKEAYENGIAGFENQNYKQAASYLEKAVAADGEKAEYKIAYGMALSMCGETERAMAQFDAAILDKDNSIVRKNNQYAYRGKGICCLQSGDYEKAEEYFDKALAVDEGDGALRSDITYYRIDTCLRLGHYGQAKTDCDTLLAEKEDAVLYEKRAEAEQALGDTEAAVADYDKVLSLDKDNLRVYLGKYQLLHKMGDSSRADEVLLAAQKVKPETDEEMYYMAKIKYYGGNPSEARDGFLSVAEKGYPFAYYYLGQMSAQSGDDAAAVEYYEKYVNNPSQGEIGKVYEQIAACYVRMGQKEKALEAYLTGMEKAGASSKKGLMRGAVALYEQQGKFHKAKKYAKEYVALYPEDAEMQRELDFLKTR